MIQSFLIWSVLDQFSSNSEELCFWLQLLIILVKILILHHLNSCWRWIKTTNLCWLFSVQSSGSGSNSCWFQNAAQVLNCYLQNSYNTKWMKCFRKTILMVSNSISKLKSSLWLLYRSWIYRKHETICYLPYMWWVIVTAEEHVIVEVLSEWRFLLFGVNSKNLQTQQGIILSLIYLFYFCKLILQLTNMNVSWN